MKNSGVLIGNAIVLSILSLLTGCAQIPQYQDATGNETAKLRLKMAPPIMSNLFVTSIDIEKCEQQAGFLWVSGGVDSLYQKRIGMFDPAPPAEGILEYVIPANKPIAARPYMHFAKLNAAQIFFGTTTSIQNVQPGVCSAPAFLPKAGEQYEIVYKVQPGKCATNIYQLKQTPNGVVRTDITSDMNIYVTGTEKDKVLCETPK